MHFQRLARACDDNQQRHVDPPPRTSYKERTTQRLYFRINKTTGILKAQSPHIAPPHRIRLPPNPRQPQANAERNTANIDHRNLRALPLDPSTDAPPADSAPTA